MYKKPLHFRLCLSMKNKSYKAFQIVLASGKSRSKTKTNKTATYAQNKMPPFQSQGSFGTRIKTITLAFRRIAGNYVPPSSTDPDHHQAMLVLPPPRHFPCRSKGDLEFSWSCETRGNSIHQRSNSFYQYYRIPGYYFPPCPRQKIINLIQSCIARNASCEINSSIAYFKN